MTLYEKVRELVGRWDGEDALIRWQKREEMLGDVIAIVQADCRRASGEGGVQRRPARDLSAA